MGEDLEGTISVPGGPTETASYVGRSGYMPESCFSAQLSLRDARRGRP